MPHYHFNLHNSIGFVADEEGQELADLDAARAEALRNARGLMAEEVRGGRLDLEGKLEIVDGRGTVLLTLAFAEAIELEGLPRPRPRVAD